MNQAISSEFGAYFARIPLKKSANIVHANALQTDWHSVCPNATFIIGNPPFIGKNYRNAQQDADMARVFTGVFNAPIIEPTQQESENGNRNFRYVGTHQTTQKCEIGAGAGGSDCSGNQQGSGGDCFQGIRGREVQPNVLDDLSQHSHVDVAYRQGIFHALTQTLSPIRLYKSLDFVSAWHYTATAYLKNHPHAKVAFVSTNSITQGEQVAILWQPLLDAGVHIHFAHRTFSWTNEAKGKAAVHCVIIGFALYDTPNKTLFVYDDIKGEPHAVAANNINPYLLDAPNIVVTARSAPVCANAPIMTRGSQPTDGGHLLLNQAEKDELISKEPQAEKWIKPFSMGDEFINNIPRYCLWLVDCSPNELRAMPLVLKRVEAVRQMRLASTDKATNKDAATPALFQAIRQPKAGYYLALPRVSSENRQYVPIGFLPHTHIAGDKLQTIPDATIYHFGIMTSSMHNAWMRTTSGRLESRYQYSAKLTYNTFPWSTPTDKQTQTIEAAAQAVLDARAQFPDASLADLYDPRTMSPDLAKAHAKLDKAVDAAYGYKGANNDGERVAFLFDLYQQMTSLLGVDKVKRLSKRAKTIK